MNKLNGTEHTVGAISMSPGDIELLFVVLYKTLLLCIATQIFSPSKSTNSNK